MRDIIIPILTFLGGYYVKHLFDNRDLRRKILEPVFDEFEKNIIYLQTEWRHIQAKNLNQGNSQEYCDTFNQGKDRLIKSRINIVFACKKIEEAKLIPLVEEAFGTLMEAISEYSQFLELRDNSSPQLRQELVKTLKAANEKFDKLLPVTMEKVYQRYWKLISGTLTLETLKSGLRKVRKAKII
jgi:hypothetical protein